MAESNDGDPTQNPLQPPASPPPPVFEQTEHQSVGVLANIIVVLGILAWIAIAVFVGLVVSFGACFKQECSSVEEGAPIWAGLLAIVLLIPTILALFRQKIGQLHIVLCAIPLALGFLLLLTGVVASLI